MSDHGIFHAAYVAFVWTALAVGITGMFALVLWLGGMAYIKTLEYLKVWNVLKLVAAIQVHGADYRDDLFWTAVQERAKKSDFEADTIIRHANNARPNNGSNEL